MLMMIAAIAGVLPASPAFAEACIGNSGHYFLGYARDFTLNTSPSYGYGVGSTYTIRASTPCTTTEQNYTTTWTMLLDHDNSGWVQSGYGKYNGSAGTVNFFQTYDGVNSSSLNTFFYSTSLVAGQTHKYVQKYLTSGCPSTPQCIASYIDGGQVTITSWNPNSLWSATPWDVQFMNEVFFINDIPPGSATAPMNMAGMEYYSGANWYSMPCGILQVVNQEATHWRHSESSCNNRATWDTRN